MLEEKIETLTKEIVALRKAVESDGVAAPAAEAKGKGKAAASEDAAPAKAKGKAKAKAAEPEHDKSEVSSMFKKAAKEDRPACKKYLKKVECEDLAELLTKPELYDDAYTFAEGILDSDDDADDDDDDDDDDED